MANQRKLSKSASFWKLLIENLTNVGFHCEDDVDGFLAGNRLSRAGEGRSVCDKPTRVMHLAKSGDDWHPVVAMGGAETSSEINYNIIVGLSYKPVADLLSFLQRAPHSRGVAVRTVKNLTFHQLPISLDSPEKELNRLTSVLSSEIENQAFKGLQNFDFEEFQNNMELQSPGMGTATHLAFMLKAYRFADAFDYIAKIEEGLYPKVGLTDDDYRQRLLHSLPNKNYLDTEFLYRAKRMCESQNLRLEICESQNNKLA